MASWVVVRILTSRGALTGINAAAVLVALRRLMGAPVAGVKLSARQVERLGLELLVARSEPVPVPWKVLEVRYELGRTQLSKYWRAAGGAPRADGRASETAVYYREIRIQIIKDVQ